jgi:hypothetical protein
VVDDRVVRSVDAVEDDDGSLISPSSSPEQATAIATKRNAGRSDRAMFLVTCCRWCRPVTGTGRTPHESVVVMSGQPLAVRPARPGRRIGVRPARTVSRFAPAH